MYSTAPALALLAARCFDVPALDYLFHQAVGS
jgi:hypothetical protein